MARASSFFSAASKRSEDDSKKQSLRRSWCRGEEFVGCVEEGKSRKKIQSVNSIRRYLLSLAPQVVKWRLRGQPRYVASPRNVRFERADQHSLCTKCQLAVPAFLTRGGELPPWRLEIGDWTQ